MDATSGTRLRARTPGARRSMPAGLGALMLLAPVLAACSDGAGAAGDESSPSTSPAVTLSAEPTDSSSPEPWRDQFNERQIASYEAALRRWDEYSERTEQIYRAGRDTPSARAVFREYDMQAVARIKSLAETYDAQGLRTIQGPTPLSTAPVSVEPRVVLIAQCNDYSDVEVTRNGKPVEDVRPEHVQTEILIEMDKPAGHDWMVGRVQLKDETLCGA